MIHQWCETIDCPVSAVAYWRRDPTGGWHGPELLSDTSAEWRDCALAADGTGRAHAVWRRADGPLVWWFAWLPYRGAASGP